MADESETALADGQRDPKRILLCSYHFPPIGGSGAQRPTKFARYLSEFGYEPVVLTGTGGAAGRWTPQDSSLSSDLPADLEVHRIPGPEPKDSRARTRIERWLRVSSPWTRWWRGGLLAASRSVGAIDAIWTIMAPYASAKASSQLARRLGCPWIADLGDPWALDEMMIYPTGIHWRLERRRMRKQLSSAAAIVMSTPEAVERVRRLLPDFRGPIVAIGNGYDEVDFGRASSLRDETAFRIVHTGYLHTDLGLRQRKMARIRRLLGGNVRPVDLLTRSHVFLVKALQLLEAEDPSYVRRIEFHLAGVASDIDKEIATASPMARLHGYLSHSESVDLLLSADLLFLPMQKMLDGGNAGIVPGKTYEYLASGRPILGAVPDGDARNLIEQAGGNYVVAPDDVEGMARIIRSLVNGTSAGVQRRDPAFMSTLTYRSRVRDKAAVLDRVLGFPSSSPDRVTAGKVRGPVAVTTVE